MSVCKFYVIDNLKEAVCGFTRFDDVKDALRRYQELENNLDKMPVLGVEVGDGSLDLIHGVNGENILVPDYRRSNNMSHDMMSVLDELNDIVNMLILDGVVSYEYCLDAIVDSARVVVPIARNNDGFEDGYCKDKILKTSVRSGRDAIDSAFVDGHGWVVYKDLCTNTEDYCKNGVLKVEALNVVYVLDRKLVGIDGRMDVHPADFVRMVDNINKPYTLVAHDGLNYNFQFKNKHDYIVGSYNNISDAVKAWYGLKEAHEKLPMYVGHIDNGRESAVFNGVDDNFQTISYEEAAKIYGFEDEKTVDSLIRNAKTTSKALEAESQDGQNKRELDSFDMDKK